VDHLRYDHTTSVLIERFTEHGLSVVHFGWSEEIPRDSYTIPLSPNVSLELDKHFPLRPNSVSVYDQISCEEVGQLDIYLPETITDALLKARRLGTQILIAEFNDENRHELLRLQATNPATPPTLRVATYAMMGQYGVGLSELIPQPHTEPVPTLSFKIEEPPAA
jgi:hypothetical protein